MNLQNNKNIILSVMKQQPDLGKTAIMKIIYMLQQVKKMDIGYDYKIYTYGPYSAEVAEDIDGLIEAGLINSKMYQYNNHVGYELNLSVQGKEELAGLTAKDEANVKDILSFTNGKSAKELELFSTIIFIENQYAKNKWKSEQDDIVKKVGEIKPHFNRETISDAYKTLLERKYIKS